MVEKLMFTDTYIQNNNNNKKNASVHTQTHAW